MQKHIIGVLMMCTYARFRDMRLPEWETNLYSYHLKLLQKHGFVEKTRLGYTLAKNGLLYVDRVSTATMGVRTQPKIITMLVLHNQRGEVLLYKRGHQPYADIWTLPYGKLHIDDVSIRAAAQREALEKLQAAGLTLAHAGDCYIRVQDESETVMSTLAHVFRGTTDEILPTANIRWTEPSELAVLQLAPAVAEIIARASDSETPFFEEYDFPW